MSDAAEIYLNKMQAYQGAFVRAIGLVAQAKRGVAALGDWRKTIILNSGSAYPTALQHLGAPALNAKEWPSASDLDAALIAYHNAKENMEIAYDAIPSSVRAAIRKPSDYIAEIEQDVGKY